MQCYIKHCYISVYSLQDFTFKTRSSYHKNYMIYQQDSQWLLSKLRNKGDYQRKLYKKKEVTYLPFNFSLCVITFCNCFWSTYWWKLNYRLLNMPDEKKKLLKFGDLKISLSRQMKHFGVIWRNSHLSARTLQKFYYIIQ